MYRRLFLTVTATALGTTSVAGCLSSLSSSDDGGTPTQTPVPFPDTCQSVPDIDGLPARPDELTEESVRSYVTEFEQVYAIATKAEYGGIVSLRVTETETIGDRYRVQLEVEGEPATPRTGTDQRTPTPLPADAYSHKVLYRLEGDRMMRVLLTYPDEAALSSDCWILSASET